MEKMKFGLTVIQFIISIYWFFNYYFFFEVKNILMNCNLCFFFSLFLIFAHSLYWCFFVSVFHNLKAILDNPIESMSTNFVGSETVLNACARFDKKIVIAKWFKDK
jgi:hypothetical protein